MKKKIISFLLAGILIVFVSPIASASMLDDLFTDGQSGWSFLYTPHFHMGRPDSNYSLDEETQKYCGALQAGIAEWGSSISMNGNTGPVLTLVEYSENSYVIMTANPDPDSSTNHFMWGYIQINPYMYPVNNKATPTFEWSDTMKGIIFAHELGHFYGLAHISDPNQIMNPYPEDSMDVRPADIRGMNVCTHSHDTSDHGTWSYVYNDVDTHKKRCGVCHGYFVEEHSPSSSYTYYTETSHYQVCNGTGCTYRLYTTHSYPSTWINDTAVNKHKHLCAAYGCGYAFQNHAYPTTWIYDSTDYHRHTCTALGCNNIARQAHYYPTTWSWWSEDEHRHKCSASGCVKYVYADHYYPTTWVSASTTQHRHQCKASQCGDWVYVNHAYPSTGTYLSTTQHRRICTASGCGYAKDEAHSYSYFGGIYVCSVCGYTHT